MVNSMNLVEVDYAYIQKLFFECGELLEEKYKWRTIDGNLTYSDDHLIKKYERLFE